MSKQSKQYLETVTELLKKIEREEAKKFEQAAEVLSKSIMEDRLIHVIGPGGHSNMGVEEMFWRAGALVPIDAILDPGTALIHGAKRSMKVERTHGYAKTVLDAYEVKKGDAIIIVNAYGINAMSIDTALEAKERGMVSIGVTSTSFAKHVPLNHPARHSSGKNLYEIVDIFINNHMPLGDAVVKFEGLEQKVAPVSTLVNCFTLNLLVIETVRELLKKGHKPPIWMSGNMPGGDEANREYEKKYIGRIKHLR